jgi:hypothetical protein
MDDLEGAIRAIHQLRTERAEGMVRADSLAAELSIERARCAQLGDLLARMTAERDHYMRQVVELTTHMVGVSTQLSDALRCSRDGTYRHNGQVIAALAEDGEPVPEFLTRGAA